MDDWVAQLAEQARGSLRPAGGTITLPGPREPIEIVTDRWGVSHVYAASREDALFAQGWLHAAERRWQIEFTVRAAQGRLSEIVSIAGLGLDKFFRTLGLGRLARQWAGKPDEDTLAAARPYFAGAQAAAALPVPIEYRFLGLQPETPQTLEDAMAAAFSITLLMGFSLSTNWPFELLRAELARHLGAQRARELTPFIGPESPIAVPSSPLFPSVAQELLDTAFDAGAARGAGSNNWVVAGSKTTTGKPILCNDPHLLVQMPAVWMEMHLCAPDFEVAGATLPGIPGVVIGHNRRIAWGFTNTQADVEDLYLERLSEDGSQYLYDGEWHPVITIEEPITVRGETQAITHVVRETRHGPLLTGWIAGGSTPTVIEDRITDPLALRWILREHPASLRAVLGMNVAGTLEEFRQAARAWPTAGQNMVFADVDGSIGYQFTGSVPMRAKGSGASPLPGWDSSYEWTGVIPFDELPATRDPQRGFIATANHRVVDLDYPHYLTNDWEMGHRIRRIVSLLSAAERLSVEDMMRIQNDTYSGIAAELVPVFLEAVIAGDREAEALKHVQAWDFVLGADSTGGAIFNAWFAATATALFEQKLGPVLFEEYYPRKAWTTNWCYDAVRDILANPQAFWVGGDGTDNAGARNALLGRALSAAVADLTARLGGDISEWRWGRLHRVHFAHVLATPIPALHDLFSSGPFEVGGGDDTINRGVILPKEGFADGAIPSMRLIMDLADFDNSRCVITTGNSGNPASPHYRDQSELWARGEYHPMPFTRAAVDSATESRLMIQPG
ncbi:MAG: penicillin acylase family protein [Actinomycetota bacterium]